MVITDHAHARDEHADYKRTFAHAQPFILHHEEVPENLRGFITIEVSEHGALLDEHAVKLMTRLVELIKDEVKKVRVAHKKFFPKFPLKVSPAFLRRVGVIKPGKDPVHLPFSLISSHIFCSISRISSYTLIISYTLLFFLYSYLSLLLKLSEKKLLGQV